MHRSILLFSLSAVLAVTQAGCAGGRPNSASAVNAPGVARAPASSPASPEVLAGVTKIAAKILGIKPEEVNVDAPLARQKVAADDLDVVEMVMAVEEAHGIEIKDEELGGQLEELPTTLTVRRLAEIVTRKRSGRE